VSWSIRRMSDIGTDSLLVSLTRILFRIGKLVKNDEVGAA